MLLRNIKMLILLSVLSIFSLITTACDRMNMYEVVNNINNGRVAYAISNTGGVNHLIIANLDVTKQYPILPQFVNSLDVGISVNTHSGKVIAYQDFYTYVAHSHFSYWVLYNDDNSPRFHQKVVPYNKGFIWFQYSVAPHRLYYFGDSNYWNQIPPDDPSFILSCLQSYDGSSYLIGNDLGSFYIFNPDDLINQIYTFDGVTLPGGNIIFSYRAYDAFYVIYDADNNSIFKLQNGVSMCLNTIPIGTGAGVIKSAAVTDDGKIYVAHYDSNSIDLRLIFSNGNYPVILHIGNHPDTNFKCNIDSLDNNHLVITASGLESGLNGMYIYNIQKMMIEKVVTFENVVALYVPR